MSIFSVQATAVEPELLWSTVGLFSLWGGIVRYLISHQKRKKQWSWQQILIQLVISGFTGFLGGFYCYEQNYGPFMIIAISGLSSWLGSSLLSWLWQNLVGKQGS